MRKRGQGIVLEVNKKHILLLAPGGEYIKIPHPGGRIRPGEEISFSSPAPAWPKLIAAAACIAVAALLLITIIPGEAPVTILPDKSYSTLGFLALDINPSLEIAFDESFLVIALEPLNSDAALLIEGIEEGASLFEVVEMLLEHSITLGFLDPDRDSDLILITLVQIEEMPVSPQALADLIEEKLAYHNIYGEVGIFEASAQNRNEAQEAGYSLNRFMLLEALKPEEREISTIADRPPVELLSELRDRLLFSEFRSILMPELPPQVPIETDEKPVPPDPPVNLPVLPDPAEKRKIEAPAVPDLPVTVPNAPVNTPGPPSSTP